MDEGILDEGIFDEGILDEARSSRRQRPVRVPSSVRKPANFGRNVSRTPSQGQGTQGNLVTKNELRTSLNSISNDVNDLKKSSLTLAASIKRLDDGYEKVVKSIAKKDRAQDNIMSGTSMMGVLSTLVNKPTLNTEALAVVREGSSDRIEVRQGQDAIQVDLTKTLLFTMLPSMMTSSSGSDSNYNMMMMLMMVLLLGNKTGNTSSSNSNDNTILLMLPMMMMMNKK